MSPNELFSRLTLALALAASVLACDASPTSPSPEDAAKLDPGDAIARSDVGSPELDAGSVDGGSSDLGSLPEAGMVDAGTIDVGTVDAGSLDAGPADAWVPVGPDDAFRFASPPEISFIEGFAESEHLGIWHLDPNNRWEPGDLENLRGWRPSVETRLDVLEGSLDGVSYDPQTAQLHYDGAGAGAWARVRLATADGSVSSEDFFVRVLVPDAIWGQNATTRPDILARFPAVPKHDYGEVSYEAAWDSIPPSASEHDPDVLLVLRGDYDALIEATLTGQTDPVTGVPDRRTQWRGRPGNAERPWFYLIGEPGATPKLSSYSVRNGGSLQVPGYRVSVVRNLEMEGMITATGGGGWLTGVPNRKFWSKLYVHHTCGMIRAEFPGVTAINDDVFGSDSPEGDTTDSYVRRGVPKAPNDWKSYFWQNRFERTGGNSLKHTIYLHGRPDGWLIYNNNTHHGGNQSSAVKGTVGHYRVLNSRISAFADESNPGDPSDRLNQQLLDVPSSSDVVIYNNVLVGGRRVIGGETDGTRTGLIWFNPRRSLWGTDVPRYPDVTFQAAPFQTFLVSYAASQVPRSDGVVAELRPDGGTFAALSNPPSFRPNANGGGSDWYVSISPSEVPSSGKYELRMSSPTAVSPTVVTLTVARNAAYLAVTSYADAGLTTPWYADGPRAYLPDEGLQYWDAMRNWSSPFGAGRADPHNPYTQKKYVAHNRFIWLQHADLDDQREEAIRDNGTYPSSAMYVGSAASRFGAVPENWLDGGVTFLINNTYEGWTIADVGTTDWRRNDIGTVTQNPNNTLYGPHQDDPAKRQWPHYSIEMSEDRRPLFVEVGGERTPIDPGAALVSYPSWFKLF